MRPKKLALKSDGNKKFSAEVFDLIRTRLTPKVGGNVNLGVKLAAEYFAPRMPATVTAAEIEDSIPQILGKFEAEARKPANGNGDRLPFNDELQAEWDAGVYKRQVTVHGIRQRFAAEIKDGVDLTPSMMKAYVVELVAEKERVAKLVDEHDDPGTKPVACGSPVHRGRNEQFQPTVRFRLHRNDAGELVRMKHPQGDDFIEVGNFLVIQPDGEKATAVPYCPDCREPAWALGRETGTMVTFYTAAGAKRKLDAIEKVVEGEKALSAQLRSASVRTYGGVYASRKDKRDWHRSRGGR